MDFNKSFNTVSQSPTGKINLCGHVLKHAHTNRKLATDSQWQSINSREVANGVLQGLVFF